MEANETPERQAGIKIKTRRLELGMSQEAVADEMRRLGHSWHQTTTAKVEVAGRPLRLNELTDLARILGVRASHLAATETDMKLEMVQNDIVALSGHAARLTAEIEELSLQLAEKTETSRRVSKLLGEARGEFNRLIAEGSSRGEHHQAS